MRQKRLRKIAVIAAKDGPEFERLFNDRMRSLGEVVSHDIKFGPEGYQAVIMYDEYEDVVETVKEEYEVQGIMFKCQDCPHMEQPSDKRYKWCHCMYSETGYTNRLHGACEVFYKGLKLGSIKPVGGGQE